MPPETPNHQPGEPFRLIQISDCHLAADPKTPYRGENADAGLQLLAHKIAVWRPHLVLATGDLSEDASAVSYRRVTDYFHLMGAPVCVLPGNHDDHRLMQQYFPTGPWHEPSVIQAGDWQLVLLNSSVDGRIDGAIGQTDIQQLRHRLEIRAKQPVLLALHHQPVPVGSMWIDRHMLAAPDRLIELVVNHDRIRGVVWGHVHQAFESRLGSARMLACPSSAVNSLPRSSRFQHDPAGPACRWLQLKPGGTIETGLLYAGKET